MKEVRGVAIHCENVVPLRTNHFSTVQQNSEEWVSIYRCTCRSWAEGGTASKAGLTPESPPTRRGG